MRTKSVKSSIETQLAAKAFTRRTVIKGAAAAGAVAAVGPFYVKDAFSSSGEINIMMWSDYLPESFTKAVMDKTGIKINFTGIGSNEELLNKLKASKGQGYDIVSPTNDRAPQWGVEKLVQPIDMKRVPIDKVNPAMAKIGDDLWNFGGKGSHWLPHIWGTEGIAWRTDKWSPKGSSPATATSGRTRMPARPWAAPIR